MIKTQTEKKARDYAAKHGFHLRRIPHSLAFPNGYIRITAPDGKELMAAGYADAMYVMMRAK